MLTRIYGRGFSVSNDILRKFYEAVENAQADNEEKLDIEELLTTRQMKIFTLYEQIVANLFSGNNLQEGLTKVIDGNALTQPEQISVLMFLKLFESFTQSQMPHIPKMDGGMYA